MLHTTFRLLHDAGACKDRYRIFARKMGGIKNYGRTKPIPLTVVLDHMGLNDCLWTLRAVLPEEEAARDRLARTWAAARAARNAAEDAAWNAAWAAARDAAGNAARAGAWDAAWDAAGNAAWDAAWAAAWAAQRKWQERRLRELLEG